LSAGHFANELWPGDKRRPYTPSLLERPIIRSLWPGDKRRPYTPFGDHLHH
jgi:hypothetical protein